MPQSQRARLRATRSKLLGATFSEVFRSGFQGARLNDIATAAGSTKGALFHHFESKQALGYALTDEVLVPILHQRWLAPVVASDDPITTLQQLFRRHIDDDTTSGNFVYGCPMNNLAQEMSSLDSGFRTRLDSMYASLRETVAAALERGQRAGRVRNDVDVRASALLIVLAQAGIWGTGKYSRDPQVMADAGEALCAYLGTLR